MTEKELALLEWTVGRLRSLAKQMSAVASDMESMGGTEWILHAKELRGAREIVSGWVRDARLEKVEGE